ncbi:MAG: CZB domain-containing protein [Gammaproteobacteria bacterium]|jgi:hypothetical protein|nr:CZB domain-containing protein [Gammaproteobacteria bacterium]MBT7308791.1 CZB domain-containing protein [Gammaproteobacteria bacterium]
MISDLAYMRLAHLSWERQLEKLLDTRHVPNFEVASHEECPLGVWLYGEGLEEFGRIPEIHQLEQDHKLFHQAVRRVMRSYKHNRNDEAEEAFEDVKRLSREIIYLLTVVEFSLLRKKNSRYVLRHPIRALTQLFSRRDQ